MAMRDDIKIAILKGGATKESLLALTGTTEKGLASQFTYMRMMGNCPMKQPDGTFTIVPIDVWNAHKAEAGSASTASLTPEQRVERAEKRSARAASAYDNAKKNHEADSENELKRLKFVKADAELKIAELELGAIEEALTSGEEMEVEGSDVDADTNDNEEGAEDLA